MHRKQNTDLILADIELEKTLRSLRKTKRAENSAMAEERADQTEEQRTAARRPPITDTMEDFWRPIIQDEYSAIRQPAVDANNSELKPALITMVQQQQFTGHPTEDPNEHLGRFLRMANTVKLNGVRLEVIKLHLFPFSLRNTAAIWYESLLYGSVDTWEELVEAYLGRFFPPSLTSERRREIIVFQQGEDESLYVAWERFKRLLKRCPMHGIDLKTHLDIVYHALNDKSKGIIDASCCGAFKRKSAEEARDLIEDLTKCNMKAPSEFSRSIGRGCHAPDPGSTQLANPNRFRGVKPYTGTPYLFYFILFFFFKLNLYLWYTNNFCNNQQSFTFTKILPPEWYPLKFIHIY